MAVVVGSGGGGGPVSTRGNTSGQQVRLDGRALRLSRWLTHWLVSYQAGLEARERRRSGGAAPSHQAAPPGASDQPGVEGAAVAKANGEGAEGPVSTGGNNGGSQGGEGAEVAASEREGRTRPGRSLVSEQVRLLLFVLFIYFFFSQTRQRSNVIYIFFFLFRPRPSSSPRRGAGIQAEPAAAYRQVHRSSLWRKPASPVGRTQCLGTEGSLPR